jgi:ABC-type oligopeptide transport system substrate-binding subunit
MKKLVSLLLVLALCLGTMVGCGEKAEEKTEDVAKESTEAVEASTDEGTEAETEAVEEVSYDEDQVYRFRDGSEVTGFNPLLNTTGPDNGVANYILETLVTSVANKDDLAETRPAACERWEVSDDGLTYTFYIREDAVWNDGVKVTANDFEFTYRTMATPEVASSNAWLFDGIIENFGDALYGENNVKPEDIGVKALDENTLEIKLVKPYSYFLDLLEGAKPVREDKWNEFGSEYGTAPEKMVTNGPFKVEEWEQNVQMVLVASENYWNNENNIIKRLERKIIVDSPVAAQSLIMGEIDDLGLREPELIQMVEAEGDRFYKVESESRAPEFYSFNAANKYFKNAKIRTAFMLGYDREKYAEFILEGKAKAIYSMIPNNISVGAELYTTRVNGENEIVKTLSEQYPDPKELLIEGLKEEGLDPDPANMEVKLATRGTSEFSKRSSEWQIQQWKQTLGVDVKIDMMEWNVMWDRVDAGEYDIATAGWGPYYNDPNGLLSIYHPVNGYFNSDKTGWVGEDADRFGQLLDQAADEPDLQKRAELYLEAEKILVGTAIISPTYLSVRPVFVADYLKEYRVNPHVNTTDWTDFYTQGRQN